MPKQKQLKLIPCNTKVLTSVGGYEGIVTAILIKHSDVTYEISYPLNGDIASKWLPVEEFSMYKGTRPLGFTLI